MSSFFDPNPAARASFSVICFSVTTPTESMPRTPSWVICVPPDFTPARFHRRKMRVISPVMIFSITLFLMSIGLFVLRTEADKNVRAPSAAAYGVEDVDLAAFGNFRLQAVCTTHIAAVVEDVHVLTDLALL